MVHQLLMYSSVSNLKSYPNFELSKNKGILLTHCEQFKWWHFGGGIMVWWGFDCKSKMDHRRVFHAILFLYVRDMQKTIEVLRIYY